MSTSRRTILSLLLVCSLFATSCVKEFAKSLGEVMVIQQEILNKFGDEVNVNVTNFNNHTTISVRFVNSGLNAKDGLDREKRARETVEIVKTHYPKIQAVSAIWIGFMKQTTRLFLFHSIEMIDLFGFDREGQPISNLGPGMAAPGVVSSRIELETRATYGEGRNETDVAANGIQLEGEAGAGLTMLPHFTVAGDANKVKGKPPALVTFDFASYSSTERFQGEVTFRFLVDGKPAVRTVGQFSASKPPDVTGQFCYLGFPYKAFQRMIAGESLTIVIGESEYRLTEEQLAALKEMADYVQ